MAKHNKANDPNQTEPVRFVRRSIRLPKDLLEWLDAEAEKAHRTPHNHLIHLMERIKAGKNHQGG